MADALGWGYAHRGAPTVLGSWDNGDTKFWPYTRPATTVVGECRLSNPGWRGKPENYDEVMRRAAEFDAQDEANCAIHMAKTKVSGG
jgi:hypothetical protein